LVETHRPATERVHLDIYLFFKFFLLFRGRGGGGMEFFFRVPSLEMWKEEGGKGLIGFSGNVFFIMERVGG